MEKKLLLAGTDSLISAAPVSASGLKIVSGIVEGDMAAIRELANHIVSEKGRIALIGAKSGENCVYVAARSEDVTVAMGGVISAAAKATGGKGGGKPDFAQGGGPEEMLNTMIDNCLSI